MVFRNIDKEKMKSKKENIKDCLDMCLSLSDDKNYHKMIKKLTHNERVCFLLDNGFEFDLPEEESKELESLYRKSIAKKDL